MASNGKDNLSVDLDDVEKKIDSKTRVLMATHYFGFHQDMPRLREFCDRKGLFLLEDCAHAFFGQLAGQPLGSFGDFAISSFRKFFPVYDGGGLISRNGQNRDVRTRPQGLGANGKAALRQMLSAVDYGRLSALRPLVMGARAARNALKGQKPTVRSLETEPTLGTNPGQLESGAGGEFDAAWIDVRMTLASTLIYKAVSKQRIIRAHRENFLHLRDAFSDLPGVRPFFTELPDGVVPYEFPLWLDDMDRLFPELEDLAVPMHRFGQFLWPDMEESLCPTTAALSHHLLQLPCHEDLTPPEIQSIIDRVRDVARR